MGDHGPPPKGNVFYELFDSGDGVFHPFWTHVCNAEIDPSVVVERA